MSDAGAAPEIRRARVRVAGLIGLILAALLLWWRAGSPFADPAAARKTVADAEVSEPDFADPLFDRYQRWLPRHVAASRVHLVRIDDESLRLLGPWPWPRSYLARLVERLHDAGAVAVGFDAIFAERDPTDPRRFAELFALSPATRAEITALTPLDEAFATNAGLLPTVIARIGLGRVCPLAGAPALAGDADSALENCVTDVRGRSPQMAAAAAAALNVDARFAPSPPGIQPFAAALVNFDAIEDTARGQGLINGAPDRDGVTRRQLLVASVAGRPTPGLALELARVALHQPVVGSEIGGGHLRALLIGGRRIPVASDGRARLHFRRYQVDDRDETSVVNVLRRPLRARALDGKIVLVGPTTIGLGDFRTTPLGRAEFGVRLHAQAVDAILTGDWLERPWWAPRFEWGLGLLLALAAIVALPGRRAALAVGASLATVAAVAGASLAVFAAAGWLLDPLRPLLLAGGAGVAVGGQMFVEVGRRARLLRDTTLKREGEMNAARDIQQAMLPDPATLARLDRRLDIDAVLEPALEIGGDLFDGFALADGRLVFLVGDVTGKGAPAALFMALSKALAHSRLMREAVPLDRIVASLNDELAIGSDVGVTLLCGIIDPASGAIDIVNAGHENPWIVRADGSVELVPMRGGLPLCTFPGAPYPLERLQLMPGDGLVIITDGVSEAQDDHGGFFGEARTRACLEGWGAAEPARTVTARLVAAVRAFEAGTPPSDDLTVLALRWRGPETRAI